MKDKRGVLRGKCLECSCDEYETQSNIAACDYCGHAPGQHQQATDVATEPQPEPQTVFKFDQLSEKRKLSLGWLPHPKSSKTMFHNKILPAFYEASYPVYNDQVFQKDLMLERNRSFKITETVDRLGQMIDFVRGPNHAAGGRFLHTGFKIKGKQDLFTCQQNIEKIKKIKESLGEEIIHIEEHDNTLFKKYGLHLRPGQASKREFNSKMKTRIESLLSCADTAQKKLEAALKRLQSFFSCEDSGPSRLNRMKKQNKSKAVKRKAQRKMMHEEELMQDLFLDVSEGVTITPEMVVVEKVAAMNQLQGTFLFSLLQRVEITQEAHALILDNLGEAGRRGYQKSRLSLHADCSGGCASVDCPFDERAASLFRSLGGQTHQAMYAPMETGLPQLAITELELDVLESMEFTPELAALLKAGCFEEEVEIVVMGKTKKHI